jgi:choline dehydrogenase
MQTAQNGYDFIIVGAGTAGSVMAARLSEDSAASVLVIEAGASTPLPEIAVPPAWPSLVDTEWNWGESTTVQSATGTTSALARGRGVGGSSAINGMLFARGHRASYDAWERAGAKDWNFDRLLPYFKRSESSRRGNSALRGADGPLVVGPADPPGELFDACLSAAVQCGHPRAADISGGEDVGFGPVDLNIVNGKRQSAADAYLNPALQRPNLELVANATVHRLLINDGRCFGVEYSSGREGSVSRVLAGEVILAAGTIGSPQLLMLSGVGPASHLRDVGIDVTLDLPGVGANLHDHPMVDLLYLPTRPVPPARNNHGELLGLFHSENVNTGPDLQVLFIDSIGGNVVTTNGVKDCYVLAVAVIQPFSRGTMRLSSPTAGDPAVIDPNYFGDDRDMQAMIAGIRQARGIGEAAALDDWRAEEFVPGRAVDDDDEALRAFVRSNFRSFWHPVGTCAIGDASTSVVDSQLRVHGISGLRVADASVMPSIPSAPTAATVYAVAERAAELIAAG